MYKLFCFYYKNHQCAVFVAGKVDIGEVTVNSINTCTITWDFLYNYLFYTMLLANESFIYFIFKYGVTTMNFQMNLSKQSVWKMSGADVNPDVRGLFTSYHPLFLNRLLCSLVTRWFVFFHSYVLFCLYFGFLTCYHPFLFSVFLFLWLLQMWHFFQLLELLEISTEQHLKRRKTTCGYCGQNAKRQKLTDTHWMITLTDWAQPA